MSPGASRVGCDAGQPRRTLTRRAAHSSEERKKRLETEIICVTCDTDSEETPAPAAERKGFWNNVKLLIP
ncbi:Hypothetical predicted protein [Xyrichtys novacula]|uniref:Uncharacterized protein n=1 Tax=Xyrichtys novacula TaxID=13765 RepID=A0AAV1F554_XYRNO|nr:Hypothetical predicted protein [Xyrichtys novacula]